ncbi:hypothetical protein ACFSX9_10115 [Flavobacterium ardleyense]|uniref:DUF304 domain-containing protein n=1 Tax=Flavobacterium ardleyense TaxID=2038737 RepID=A0ABW5ZAF4_9FLAO
MAVNIFLLFTLIVEHFFFEFSFLKKDFESEYKIRSIARKTSLLIWIFPIFWTLLIFSKGKIEEAPFFIALIWVPNLMEIIVFFIYKVQRPFTLFIKGNEMIIKQNYIRKRNLSELTQINYDRFSKEFILSFKHKSKIYIKTREYCIDDTEKLLEILIEKSEYNLMIPQNYKLTDLK